MTQPKPNTMDDWIDGVIQGLKAASDWEYGIPQTDEMPKNALTNPQAKALITAKMQEVDRAARIEGYAQGASDCITDLHNQGAISGLSKAESLKRINQMREDRLNSLKGGDV